MEKRYIILWNICSIYIDLLLVFSLLIEDSISTFHRVICTIPNALDCEYLMCEITVCVCVCVFMLLFCCKVMFNSLWHQVQSVRLFCPWDFPCKNTEIGCHFLLQGIFFNTEIEITSSAWQTDSLPLSHQGSHSLSSLCELSSFLRNYGL